MTQWPGHLFPQPRPPPFSLCEKASLHRPLAPFPLPRSRRSGALLLVELSCLKRRRSGCSLIFAPGQQGDRPLLAGPYSEETRGPREEGSSPWGSPIIVTALGPQRLP